MIYCPILNFYRIKWSLGLGLTIIYWLDFIIYWKRNAKWNRLW